MKNKAIYPGTFDPITNGHLDVIKRAMELFETVYVSIAENTAKKTLFTPEERYQLIKQVTKGYKGLRIEMFDGLVVDYAKKKNVRTIIRGLRAISDFDYEFQMALTNRKLGPHADTVFLMPSERHFYISSRLIKEIVTLKGSVKKFVPAIVAQALQRKIGKK